MSVLVLDGRSREQLLDEWDVLYRLVWLQSSVKAWKQIIQVTGTGQVQCMTDGGETRRVRYHYAGRFLPNQKYLCCSFS